MELRRIATKSENSQKKLSIDVGIRVSMLNISLTTDILLRRISNMLENLPGSIPKGIEITLKEFMNGVQERFQSMTKEIMEGFRCCIADLFQNGSCLPEIIKIDMKFTKRIDSMIKRGNLSKKLENLKDLQNELNSFFEKEETINPIQQKNSYFDPYSPRRSHNSANSKQKTGKSTDSLKRLKSSIRETVRGSMNIKDNAVDNYVGRFSGSKTAKPRLLSLFSNNTKKSTRDFQPYKEDKFLIEELVISKLVLFSKLEGIVYSKGIGLFWIRFPQDPINNSPVLKQLITCRTIVS